ncbi:hypothetical protein Fmac_005827 [Flemingia macrophylla]|uniref:Protein kinase domain-containing protein n=1 Tax=Flemingia macrophylla TaxID=520843 RepID=A0ABD1N8W0_9FABA
MSKRTLFQLNSFIDQFISNESSTFVFYISSLQRLTTLEFVQDKKRIERSDVYSFGVVLLELLTGRCVVEDDRPGFSEETLVDWAKPFLSDSRRVLRIMDRRLGGQYSKKGAQATAVLALQCLNTNPKFRPPMVEVLAALEGLNSTNSFPRTPKFENHATKHPGGGHSHK